MENLKEPMIESKIKLRVRYVECDPMGYLHHSNYLPYLEMGRTELFRQSGGDYRTLESEGFFFVVTKLSIQFKRPARFDDELEIVTRINRKTHVRIDHDYEIFHLQSRVLISTASSTIACVDRNGQLIPIPAKIDFQLPDGVTGSTP
jgi:acyl-CoA thioester hydrolase